MKGKPNSSSEFFDQRPRRDGHRIRRHPVSRAERLVVVLQRRRDARILALGLRYQPPWMRI